MRQARALERLEKRWSGVRENIPFHVQQELSTLRSKASNIRLRQQSEYIYKDVT